MLTTTIFPALGRNHTCSRKSQGDTLCRSRDTENKEIEKVGREREKRRERERTGKDNAELDLTGRWVYCI